MRHTIHTDDLWQAQPEVWPKSLRLKPIAGNLKKTKPTVCVDYRRLKNELNVKCVRVNAKLESPPEKFIDKKL